MISSNNLSVRIIVSSSCSSSIQITQFASWRHTVALRFFASAVAYKDIWVSIGYVQKHVVARSLHAFALARAPRISNASVIRPLSNKKMTSHDMCLSKRRRIACHKRAVAAFTVHLLVWLN